MNLSVEHLGLPARDPAALKDWYARVLGAKVVFSNGHTPPTFLLAFPAAKAELEGRGLIFTGPSKPASGGGRVLFFQDPEGNLLHLVERTADSTIR